MNTFEKQQFAHGMAIMNFCLCKIELTNATSGLMDLMNRVFSKYLDHFVVIFIDDILIYLANRQEHEEHLKMDMEVLREKMVMTYLIRIHTV
jgi:hypothetical protein